MFTMSERSELLAKVKAFLATRSRPVRPEKLAYRLGLDWLSLAQNDRRVVCGIMSRLGWRPTEGAKWERAEVEVAT
jgi:hypothetical protein